MTEYQLKRRAIENFKHYWVTKDVQRKYQRAWIRSIQQLGDKWKLAGRVEKNERPFSPLGIPFSSIDVTYRVRPLHENV